MSDPILQLEPAEQFAAREVRSGRVPLWDPNQYAGVPYRWPRFSPFFALRYVFTSPVAIAWRQLLADRGRRAGRVPVLPPCLAGPLLAGGLGRLVLSFDRLLRLLAVVPRAVFHRLAPLDPAGGRNDPRRSPWRWGPLLALLTGLNTIGGQPDLAGQVLLASGIYAVGRFVHLYWRRWFDWQALRRSLRLAAAWMLGILLATPELLPVIEYSRTGDRIIRRSQGEEERPPVGLAALPQTVLPDMYGSTQQGNAWIPPEKEELTPDGKKRFTLLEGNLLESPSAAYAGLLATLLLAPLAWCSRRHRSINIFWIVLGIFSLAWVLNLPGLVYLLRLPGLNMMSHNRLTFVASFAVMAMAAVGLNVLVQGTDAAAMVVLAAGCCWSPRLSVWCTFRAAVLPEPLATNIESPPPGGLWDRQSCPTARGAMAVLPQLPGCGRLCVVALGGWLVLWSATKIPALVRAGAGRLLVADLLWFGYGRSPQCDPALYYPPLPVLEEVKAAAAKPPGRVIGCHCLPAVLAETQSLRDVRGYDAVDPAPPTWNC